MTSAYEIRIRGRLSRTLIAEFELLDLAASTEPIETVLYGPVVDQAALHGLLRRVEALGLELIEVRRLMLSDAHEQDLDVRAADDEGLRRRG